MPTEQEFKHHRTFLSLSLCKTIYNEDERYQNSPGGPPGRQQKIDSDPVYAYHVRSGPRYPQRAPGTIDRQYNADRIREDGPREPLVIIPKRDQQFSKVATEWELKNSVLCTGAGSFSPVVDKSMEVTGHSASLRATSLIHPEGVFLKTPGDYIEHDVPLFLWTYQIYDSQYGGMVPTAVPPGWQSFNSTNYKYKGQYFSSSRKQWNGGIDVVVFPNGKVVRAEGKEYQANNGHAESSWSPLDFWSPGARWAAGAFRALTNRAAAATKAAYTALRGPTTEAAEAAAARLSTTLMANAASGGNAAVQVFQTGRRTLIMGADMAKMRGAMTASHSESGLYDVIIHGNNNGFAIVSGYKPNGDRIYQAVSVQEVANAVRPHLARGDKIRLLSCSAGQNGPEIISPNAAQKLSDALDRELWASEEVLDLVPSTFSPSSKVFVPDSGGKFRFFRPQRPIRGHGDLTGPGGGRVEENVMYGEINKK